MESPVATAPGELTSVELAAWRGMLRVHHRVRERLGVELARRHGLSMADYDALVALYYQPGQQMRMSVLADDILQPRSSLTRLVGSLEARGLLERIPTADDGRGTRARLTTAGKRLFRSAHRTHVRNVRALFLDHLSEQQQTALAHAWANIDPDALS